MAIVVIAAVLAGPAVAEEADFPVERFRPSMSTDGLLDVEWGGVREHLQWDVGLWTNYAQNPLVLYDGDTRVGALIAHRLGGDLMGTVALFDWVQLAADLPLLLFQTRDAQILPEVLQAGNLAVVGVGDLRLAPKLRLLRSQEQLVDLAVIPAFTVPTALPRDKAYLGEGQMTFMPELALSRGFDHGPLSGLRLAANVAYRLRPLERFILDVSIGSELLYRGGVGFRFHDVAALPLEIDLTVSGATYANAPFRSLEESPLELLAGVKYELFRVPASQGAGDSLVVTAFGGSGTGMVRGFGTPDLRVFAGVSIGVPTDIDKDDDDVVDKVDSCPARAEDLDAYDDLDGCPDPDNDGDALLDGNDQCPNDAEDHDGFNDLDGCPDPDNDNDGVNDGADPCASTPGPADNAGCPWPDADSDGIFDKDDACAAVKGVSELKGCPDADADGVTDAADRCPLLPGPARPYGGCPDADGDGITDDKDPCPAAAETINNVADDDGCPDEGQVLVSLTQDHIIITDQVLFATGKATIQAQSFLLLDQVAAIARNHSAIQRLSIEGHSDDVGDAAQSLTLSQQRADSVKAYLVGRGIDPSRLTAIGYGPARPLADNATRAGKERNRRIEFLILGDDDLGAEAVH